MIHDFKILTVTHKQAPLSAIENYVIKAADDEALALRLRELKAAFGIEELFYLPTCNRVMYFFIKAAPLDSDFVQQFFTYINPELSQGGLTQLTREALVLEGSAAIQHLYEVGASVDSLVVGERQILGQLRETYERQLPWAIHGQGIRLAIQQAVLAAKEVYSQTRIGEKPVSVVSLAIQKLMQANLPRQARILLIGAGQTNALVSKFLSKYHFNNVTVFNRSLSKAQDLANVLGGHALELSELATYTQGFDAMIVCTGATEAIITPALYAQLLQGDAARKLVIDLSIPNNVSRDTVQSFSMQYIEIEDIKQMAQENLAFREQEVDKARQLLSQHLAEFPVLLRQRRMTLALRDLPEAVRAVKDKALNEVFQKEVAVLDEPTRALLERMMSYMEKKCISIPMKAAKALAE